MKRIYIALAFILFSLIAGTVEFITINKNAESYMSSISKIGNLVKEGRIEDAEKMSKKAAEDFEKISKSILTCYYSHDELEEINEQLYRLEDLLDDNRVEDFHEVSHILKNKLLSLKEKEQITIQNIL